MTIRYLVVAIDDERPLGPQLRAALGVLSWKTVAALAGDLPLRSLRRIFDLAEISARQTVRFGEMVRPSRASSEGQSMAGILGSTPSVPFIPAPTPPAQDDTAQLEAARKEREADARATGRSATILTDFALATQTPSTLKPTLGA